MKYIIFILFICSVTTINAQTQRIKDLLPQGGDINASQHTGAQKADQRQFYIMTSVNETILLYLNGKPNLFKGASLMLQMIAPNKISCMEIITDEKKIAAYTRDANIKKLIIVETKE